MYRFSTTYPGTCSTGDAMMLTTPIFCNFAARCSLCGKLQKVGVAKSTNFSNSECCDVCARPGGSPTDSGALACAGCNLFVKYYETIPLSCPTGLQDCPLHYTKTMCNYCRLAKCRQLGIVIWPRPPQPLKPPKVAQKRPRPPTVNRVEEAKAKVAERLSNLVVLEKPKLVVVEQTKRVETKSSEVRDADGIYCQVCWVSMPTKVTRYGVLACHDCAVFFSNNRDMFFVKPCENNERCRHIKETNWTMACASCRMWKCVNAGMSIAHEPEVHLLRGIRPLFRPRPCELSNVDAEQGGDVGEKTPYFMRYPLRSRLSTTSTSPPPQQLKPFYQEESEGFDSYGGQEESQELLDPKSEPSSSCSQEALRGEGLRVPKEEPDYCNYNGAFLADPSALIFTPKEDPAALSQNSSSSSEKSITEEELVAPKPEPNVSTRYETPVIRQELVEPKAEPGDTAAKRLAKEPKREVVGDDGYGECPESGPCPPMDGEPEPKKSTRLEIPITTTMEKATNDPDWNKKRVVVIRAAPHPERLPPNKLSIIPSEAIYFAASGSSSRNHISLKNVSQKTIIFKAASSCGSIRIGPMFGVLHSKETARLSVEYFAAEKMVGGNERIFVEYMNAPMSKELCEERFSEEGMRYRKVIRVEVDGLD